MNLKSIPHNLPIVDGKFSFYTGNDRVESSIDFVISFYDRTRDYKRFFSTLFIFQLIQANTSSIVSARGAIMLRLTSLLESSIKFLNVNNSSLIVPKTDRKVTELYIDYSNTEPDQQDRTENVYARIL